MTELEKELRDEVARGGLVEGELLLRAADELASLSEQLGVLEKRRVHVESSWLERHTKDQARISELERELAEARDRGRISDLNELHESRRRVRDLERELAETRALWKADEDKGIAREAELEQTARILDEARQQLLDELAEEASYHDESIAAFRRRLDELEERCKLWYQAWSLSHDANVWQGLWVGRHLPLIDAAKAFRAAFRCGEMVTTAALDLKDAALALPEEP